MPKTANSYNLLNDYHLLSYDVLDSTNEEAKRLAEGGASHGAVIWAKSQMSGKGRMGREWISQDGNLFVSVLLAPQCDEVQAAQLSFVSAIAAMDALEPLLPGGEKLKCKWPNDIMLEGKKLGGILVESFKTDDPDTGQKGKRWVVVGVGINVEHSPRDVHIPATSLKDAGVEIVSAKIVLSRFVYHFICQYDLWGKKGFAPIRKRWLSAAYGVGKDAHVHLPEGDVTGIFKGIDKNGALELLVGGKKRLISAGDVFFS